MEKARRRAKPKRARSYSPRQKRRRSRSLLAQACLSVTIVALLFGISYACVQIVHGQPVLPVAAWNGAPGSAQNSSLTPQGSAPAQQGTSVPQDGSAVQNASAPSGAQAANGPTELRAPVQKWNTAVPLERTLPADLSDGDARMIAVPQNGRLSTEYFRTALFIGDSLSQGFALYEPTRGVAPVCAYKSTSPNQVLQNYEGQRPDGSRVAMWDDINQQAPDNIYVLYGTNALISQSDEAFLKYYGDLLDRLRERFPTVPIYVQSITPTTAAQGAKQPALENGHIRQVNAAIARMASEKGLYYLNAQEALTDTEGNLRADYTGTVDGIHMNPKGYAEWADYLLTHTVYSKYNAQFLVEGPYA